MSDGPQIAIPAVYMRGGTSRALVFHAADLPGTAATRDGWDAIFSAALGSPDLGERQLDGLGGGISSLSKVAVISRSDSPDADIDYLFAQASVRDRSVSYRGNCGNISSAVGPFAVDEGLVAVHGDSAFVRIRNVNTGKLINASFPLLGGKAAVRGDLEIQGVAGTGAPVRLDFLKPGGATTGRTLPTGKLVETLLVPDVGSMEVSLVDAANPVSFVRASAFGLVGDEPASVLGADRALLARLDSLRVASALAMGIVDSAEEARSTVTNLPLVALISACGNEAADIRVRMISAAQPHKAIPLTGAMCLAVAARLPGTLVADCVGPNLTSVLHIAHASGIIPVDADIVDGEVRCVTVFRTARRLMQGAVLIPR